MIDLYYWEAYGDEGRKKYAIYETKDNFYFREFFKGRRTRPAKKGDLHRTTCWKYLVSQHMVDTMGDILIKYGNLTKVNVIDRKDNLYHYEVTNYLDCIDYEKSTTFSSENPLLGVMLHDNPIKNTLLEVIKPVVNMANYDGSMIFRIKGETEDSSNFVTKQFIDLVTDNNLVGFKFFRCNPAVNSNDLDCSNIFEIG